MDVYEIVALIPGDIARRMRNWVQWRQGTSGHYAGGGSFWTDYGCRFDRYRTPSIPVLVAEAQETERALLSLAEIYSAPLALFWLSDNDASYRELGTALGINHETVKIRLVRGHELLVQAVYRSRAKLAH